MARAIWTGALSFGLVNVPVGLYSATEEHEVRFHQFQRGASSRIRYKRVNADTGREVDYTDIVKGADIGDGRYVVLTAEELEAVEPGKSRTIDILDFVDAVDIDPIYYQKSYYLAPQEETAEKAYSLLAQAMAKASRIGIATFVLRSKQYLAAIRPHGNVLVLETMFFADEVRNPTQELGRLQDNASPRSKEVDMAVSLIESMTTKWSPDNYRDTYTDRVQQLIEAKKTDQEIVIGAETEGSAQVLDLMQALQASVERARRDAADNRDPAKDMPEPTRSGSGS